MYLIYKSIQKGGGHNLEKNNPFESNLVLALYLKLGICVPECPQALTPLESRRATKAVSSKISFLYTLTLARDR